MSLEVRKYTVSRRQQYPIRSMWRDIVSGRELAWQIFIRNTRSQYRQSFFGYGWVIVPPLATSLLWVFLNQQKIISVETPGVPYPVFVFVGMILWKTFIDSVILPLRTVNQSKAMLSKINFSRSALIVASLYQAIFNFCIGAVLLAGILVYFNVAISSMTAFAILGVLCLFFVGTVLGVVLVPFGMLYKDVERGMLLFAQFGLYLTPVIYPPPSSWPLNVINYLNPASSLINVTRDLLLLGQSEHVMTAGIVVMVTIPIGVLALFVYHVSMPTLIERMGS